jgi:hypothetical protein
MAMAESQDSNSIETFDLAGDLDLEAQLTLTESKVDLKPDTAHAPATLTADDPESRTLLVALLNFPHGAFRSEKLEHCS